jgi:hypothetical protein
MPATHLTRLHPTGAPPTNATFTSSPDGAVYYSYVARKANFSQAGRGCTAWGGTLAMWKDDDTQYSVERYFYQVGAAAGLHNLYD